MLHLDTCMHIESTTKIAIGVGLYPDEWGKYILVYKVLVYNHNLYILRSKYYYI